MSFPNYPDPARRANMLQAHQLRQQGLTLRQIAERMDRAVSTVHAYLHDFEQFRTDLVGELAADQIVTHLIQLADIDDPHHDRRLAAVRELRLLLTSLPEIHRGEVDRTMEILRAGVAIDRYGNRYPKPDHMHPPTSEELAQAEQAELVESPPSQPELDQALVLLPEASRTEPNKPEQELSPHPAHNGKSARIERNSPAPPEPFDALIGETIELFPHLQGQSDRHILNFLEQFTEPDRQPSFGLPPSLEGVAAGGVGLGSENSTPWMSAGPSTTEGVGPRR